jgi:hypothetical protein
MAKHRNHSIEFKRHDAITAFTEDGIENLKQIIADMRADGAFGFRVDRASPETRVAFFPLPPRTKWRSCGVTLGCSMLSRRAS